MFQATCEPSAKHKKETTIPPQAWRVSTFGLLVSSISTGKSMNYGATAVPAVLDAYVSSSSLGPKATKSPVILMLDRKSVHVISSALMAKGKIKQKTFAPEHSPGTTTMRASFHAPGSLGLQLCK